VLEKEGGSCNYRVFTYIFKALPYLEGEHKPVLGHGTHMSLERIHRSMPLLANAVVDGVEVGQTSNSESHAAPTGLMVPIVELVYEKARQAWMKILVNGGV
jgi:hypothetical protein